MRFLKRISTVAFAAVLLASAALAVAAPVAQAATCTAPKSVADFPDVASYLAALEAYNKCVSGEGSTATTSALAFTGSQSNQLIVVGVAALAVGGAALVVSRRRKASV